MLLLEKRWGRISMQPADNFVKSIWKILSERRFMNRHSLQCYICIEGRLHR